jgi:hypothetical protein
MDPAVDTIAELPEQIFEALNWESDISSVEGHVAAVERNLDYLEVFTDSSVMVEACQHVTCLET